MDRWVIEYDNKNFDSHIFMTQVQDEFVAMMTAAGGGPAGTTVYANEEASSDNKLRLYFNPKAAGIVGVSALLSKYGATPCEKPKERCSILAGNHAEPLESTI